MAFEDDMPCDVLINQDGAYSLWPAGHPVPAGWRATGQSGSKAECVAHIDRCWADIRSAGATGQANAAGPSPVPCRAT